MKALVWNCRGIGSPHAVRALKEVIRSSCPLVVGLIETKCGSRRCEIVRISLGFDCCFVVPARGRSGDLALFWNNSTNVEVVSYSGFHIDFLLSYKGSAHITLFYGSPKATLRHKSWDLMRKMRRLISVPWCVIGDFNEICTFSETTSRNVSRQNNMDRFRNVLLDCGLMDLGYKGYKFTYSNRRQGSEEVASRLDRAVGDDLWVDRFPNAIVEHLISHRSDHCPLLLSFDGIIQVNHKLFRFESMWMRDTSLVDMVRDSWTPNKTGITLNSKLTDLSQHLNRWNKRNFGNVGSHLKRLKEELAVVRQGNRSHASTEKEKKITSDIDEWLTREECMWAQRSRISWLGEGDNNTRFFHLKANARKKINSISSLLDGHGISHTDHSEIEQVAISYFQELFSSSVSMSEVELMESLQFIPTIITEAHNRILTEPYTEIEIRRALFQLYPFKAPGLDGYPAGFFQKFWGIIKMDFLASCFAVLHEGIIPQGTNDTLIVLIPKIRDAVKMEDYRPISLTSVVSKTVAKAIVNRLQQILMEVISPAQSAFIKGRLITDNYLIAHEVAHFIKNKRQGKNAYGSLKLDMSKAYDRVEWKFLKIMLLSFGFDERWVSIILKYVSSVRYSIRMNGKNSVEFTPGRGLRQGDPLSPYLFILSSEWLSYSLSKLEMERRIEGIKVCLRAPYVSHLMFADDCLLLFKANESTAGTLVSLLKSYETVSGQVINYNKSELVLSPNVSQVLKNSFRDQLSVPINNHHAKYLGLPLTLQRKLTLNFSGVMDKIWKKTESWSSKNLSSGGKEILIKAVLQALPQFAMNCFILPEQIIKKMHSSIRNFWWSHSSSKKPMHWIKSQILCQDRSMGGLGFKDLNCINMAFLAKQAWRIYTQPDLLVSRIYKAKYCHDHDMLQCGIGYRPSFCWRSILRGFELVRAGSVIENNGQISWPFNSSGVLDICSAYKLMMQLKTTSETVNVGCSDLSQSKKFWQDFWKMSVPRKIKIFGWRGYHAGLPTGISLHRRGLTNDVGCGNCGFKIETYSHVFIHCWFARAVWDCLGIPELIELPHSVSFADIIHFSWCSFAHRKRQLILVTLWFIWYNRNKRKHEGCDLSLHEVIYKVNNLARSFEQHNSKFSSSMRFLYCSDLYWKKPPVGFIKFNSDASWKESSGGGVGIVASDSGGSILAVKAIKCVGIMNSVSCEGIGLLESLRIAENLKADKAIFETDCSNIVNWINISPDEKVIHEEWFKESTHILHRHVNWKVFLIRREANVVADHLAKRVIDHNWSWTRLDCCPRLSCLSSCSKPSVSFR
ncbi:unnamed protein product [Rhodiola kirilowii]